MIEQVYNTGALLQVVNPYGLTVYKNAKLAQFVFHELKDEVRIHSFSYAFFLSFFGELLTTTPLSSCAMMYLTFYL